MERHPLDVSEGVKRCAKYKMPVRVVRPFVLPNRPNGFERRENSKTPCALTLNGVNDFFPFYVYTVQRVFYIKKEIYIQKSG